MKLTDQIKILRHKLAVVRIKIFDIFDVVMELKRELSFLRKSNRNLYHRIMNLQERVESLENSKDGDGLNGV